MRAWLFQDPKQKTNLGDKCPWSVGWLSADGKRKGKKVGAKSTAEKFKRKVEAELAIGLCTVGRKRTTWADFRTQFLEVALAGQAAATVVVYEGALDMFQRIAKPTYMDSITTAIVDVFTAKRARESANAPIRRKAKATDPATKAAAAKPRRIAAATVNKELCHIRAALRKAWRWGMLPQPPQFAMLREPERDPYFIDDATFKALYDACGTLARPEGRRYAAGDWWKALLCFAYMTGWRIGEILDLRRADVNLDAGVATLDAENRKGRRTVRVELHPIVVEHLKAIVEFQPFVFDWPYPERTLWTDSASLKAAAKIEFSGAFHRLRFGFANANVDNLDADVLQRLMRHQAAATTRRYINAAARMKRAGTAAKLHVPDVLPVAAVS